MLSQKHLNVEPSLSNVESVFFYKMLNWVKNAGQTDKNHSLLVKYVFG